MLDAVRHRATTMPVAVRLLMASLATALLVRFNIDCVKAVFTILQKGKGSKPDCHSYRPITMYLEKCFTCFASSYST